MKLKEAREWLNSLPEELDDFIIVNGEVGTIPNSSEQSETDNDLMMRIDKPITVLYVDAEAEAVCLFHQTEEDLSVVLNDEVSINEDVSDKLNEQLKGEDSKGDKE
jgi:hypothetical protein